MQQVQHAILPFVRYILGSSSASLFEMVVCVSALHRCQGTVCCERQALDKLQHEWEGAELMVLEYRETGTYIIKVEEALSQQLDDNIVMLQSMGFSPYKKAFEERLAKWDSQLNLV